MPIKDIIKYTTQSDIEVNTSHGFLVYRMSCLSNFNTFMFILFHSLISLSLAVFIIICISPARLQIYVTV